MVQCKYAAKNCKGIVDSYLHTVQVAKDGREKEEENDADRSPFDFR